VRLDHRTAQEVPFISEYHHKKDAVLLREIIIEGIERMMPRPHIHALERETPDSSDNSTHIFDGGGKQLRLIESKQKVLLGYGAGSGNAVYIPTDMNIAATGQTRRTGKTTALEAIITRGKFTCLTFRTKVRRGKHSPMRIGFRLWPLIPLLRSG
jgi:hypothetical protein